MMKKTRRISAAVCAVCMLFTACGKNNDSDNSETTTAATPAFSVTKPGEMEIINESDISPDDVADDTMSVYTGKTVENEEDLAIFKFNCTPPEGYQTMIDSAEGKQYISPNGTIVVKAQNFKEEFQELEVFADQGCAAIKVNNMLSQADTEFSEPVKTTVAGFDAIRYDYNITAYIFKYETDAQGAQVTGDDGNPIITDEKEIYGEYVNRIYYFYSDEDVFYVICESPKDKAEAAASEFDEFIASISISK